jgi:tetratricopeptide (TPR) repeat protein
VLTQLQPLKDQTFVGTEAFAAGLDTVLSKEQAMRYGFFISEHAKKTEQRPDLVGIVNQLDAMRSGPLEQILADITIGEIYLTYNLSNEARKRFEAALSALSAMVAQDGNTLTAKQLLGLHMALGLLYERVCKNNNLNNLAINEFNEAIKLGEKKLEGVPCQEYAIAHYHIGMLKLQPRDRILPITSAGEVTVPRPTRIPRELLDESQQKGWKEVPCNLRNIPKDVINEFERYWICPSKEDRAKEDRAKEDRAGVARFIIDNHEE